jgi:hypothetical protein
VAANRAWIEAQIQDLAQRLILGGLRLPLGAHGMRPSG